MLTLTDDKARWQANILRENPGWRVQNVTTLMS